MNATEAKYLITSMLAQKSVSQFPLWDFVECNRCAASKPVDLIALNSQFPLWDFVECNLWTSRDEYPEIAARLSIPFVGFR